MTSKIILLVDMDGVVCDWYQSVLRRYRLANPGLPDVEERALQSFKIVDSYPDFCHAPLYAAMSGKGLFRNLDAVEGAVAALKDIEENYLDRIDPFLCTAPYLYSEDQCSHSEKALWVEERLGKFWLERLIVTRDKTVVRGHLLIDDKPEITGAMTPTWQQVVYDRPWNHHVNDRPHFTWADWPALRESILNPS